MYVAQHKLHINLFRWKRKWKCSHQDLRKVLWLHKKTWINCTFTWVSKNHYQSGLFLFWQKLIWQKIAICKWENRYAIWTPSGNVFIFVNAKILLLGLSLEYFWKTKTNLYQMSKNFTFANGYLFTL